MHIMEDRNDKVLREPHIGTKPGIEDLFFP